MDSALRTMACRTYGGMEDSNHPGDVFANGGLASKWSVKTKRQIVKDYGM
ncbi:MAG: hypothetical protein RIB43_02635 [Rhodospirillaceae bacterium]